LILQRRPKVGSPGAFWASSPINIVPAMLTGTARTAMRRLWISFLAVSYFSSACAHPRKSTSPVASIPKYTPDSITHASSGVGLSALVGTVEDSVSGRPLGDAQVLLTSRPGQQHYFSYTNQEGGFIVQRVPPGSYDLIVRKVNYHPYTSSYTLRPGVVDTLRARILEIRY
jgi:hypothetical protein